MGNAQWRYNGEDFEWTKEYSDKLLEKISKIKPAAGKDKPADDKNTPADDKHKHAGDKDKPADDLDKPAAVICKPLLLMFGPTGHGKSCFINSISSINKGRKSNITITAKQDAHVTTVFRKYEIKNGKLDNVVLADLKGVVAKDENALLVKNGLAIVDGHMKQEFPFDCTKEISVGDEFYNGNPMDSEKVHCVVFVFDCRYVESLNVEYATSTRKFIEDLNKKDIPRIVLLTHTDKICSLRRIFHDRTIKKKVDFITGYIGVPLENIHPVQNFDETTSGSNDFDKVMCIPLLLALQQALHFACDTIEKRTS